MYKLARPFFMVVETPLHAGSGSDLGIVDLPIQRERHTGFPKIESSGIKGCVREAFNRLKDNKDCKKLVKNFPGVNISDAIVQVFGPEKGNLHSGALGFTDARLLLFPVRSVRGVFAWITCPQVLQRLVNDLKLADITGLPDIPPENTVPNGCRLLVRNDKVIFEEYAFTVKHEESRESPCSKWAKWLSENILPPGGEYSYWRKKMATDIVVLSFDDFRDFVNLFTEVITRIRIDNNTGTVKDGALFTEEYLPTESVLYSLALASPLFIEKKEDKGVFTKLNMPEEAAVMKFWKTGMPDVIQIGGNATIGKGLIRVRVMEV